MSHIIDSLMVSIRTDYTDAKVQKLNVNSSGSGIPQNSCVMAWGIPYLRYPVSIGENKKD